MHITNKAAYPRSKHDDQDDNFLLVTIFPTLIDKIFHHQNFAPYGNSGIHEVLVRPNRLVMVYFCTSFKLCSVVQAPVGLQPSQVILIGAKAETIGFTSICIVLSRLSNDGS